MLNENQINLLPERIYERLNAVNTEYLETMGRVLREIGELRPTDVHRLQQMYDTGADLHRISMMLAELTDKNVQEIYNIFDVVAKENYDYAHPFYDAKAIPFIPYEKNERMQKYVRALAKQTVDEYVNLTQHTAFAVFEPGGKSIAPLFSRNREKVATSLSDTYTKMLDYAVTKAQLGESSYSAAVREITKAMANSGIRTVDYATGYSRRLDTAVRQNVLWGIKQCNQNVADMVGEEFGADGYEISYHSNPRPSHADMGGRQYAIGKEKIINGVHFPSFADVAHLLDEFNCLHFKFSIILGISEPTYSEEQLAELKANDAKTFEFEGNTYTGYEGTQLQRKIETAIRNQKDIANMAKAAGNDDLRREAQTKINQLTSKYHQLSKASGLPTKMERLRVDGFRTVKTKTVDKSVKSDIIKEQSKSGITVITDKAIENVPLVKIRNLSEEQNVFIQQQHRELLRYTRKYNEGNETAFVFSAEMKGKTIHVGSDDEIEFGTALLGRGSKLFVMHNHPRNSSYSIKDIVFMLSNDNINTLSIVKNNGTIEILTKTDSYNMQILKVDLARLVKKNVRKETEEEYATVVSKLLKKHSGEGGMFEWIKK